MSFELPKLNFLPAALEPYIDAKTMEIHHGKHHGAYVANLNNALEGTPDLNSDIVSIIKNISKYPVAVRDNGGGHFNHTLFWNILSPQGGGQPVGLLNDAINSEFGSFDTFKETFTKSAMTRFGSGWAWLSIDGAGKLCVCSTANQDNPLMDIADCKGTPIMGLDVWEHAYYLNYQNRRADYINAFWNIVNWKAVSESFEKIVK